MTTTNRRVRIRIHDIELDLEGPEEFLEKYRTVYEPLLDMLPALARGPPLDGYDDLDLALPNLGGLDDVFEGYRPSLTDYDRVLIACYHIQQDTDDHAFIWPDVSRLLVTHGMAVADAASEFQYLVDARLVMKLKKGSYRVSANGVDAIHNLMMVSPS